MGDAIAIVTPDGKFEYQVESTEMVSPDDVQVLHSTGENTLTLITCFPFYYVGPAPKRFIVRARQIEDHPQQSAYRPRIRSVVEQTNGISVVCTSEQ